MYTYERSDLFRTQMAELWTGPKAAVPLLSGNGVSTARERPCARVPMDVCARPRVCPRVRPSVPVCSCVPAPVPARTRPRVPACDRGSRRASVCTNAVVPVHTQVRARAHPHVPVRAGQNAHGSQPIATL